MQRPLVIGTRGSPLALAQARAAQAQIAAALVAGEAADACASPDEVAPIRVIKTTGDRIQDRALAEAGGKGLFTKELEEALIDGRVDVAVHSMKDVPTRPPAALALAAFLVREDPRDAFIARTAARLADLPAGARVGTASLRRRAQALAARPDVEPVLLRGNVETRLAAVAEGRVDATFLAVAGLRRLGLADRASGLISAEDMLPAAAQGAVGLQTRADDAEAQAALATLNHPPTHLCVVAERAFLDALDGSCRTPIAAYGVIEAGQMWLRGALYSDDGQKVWAQEGRAAATLEAAAALGRDLGQEVRAAAGPHAPRPL